MEDIYRKLIQSVGDDPNRQGLKGTPRRASAAFRYLMKGYHDNIEEIVKGAIFEADVEEIILVRDIELYSMCEHHLLPFFGKCHVGYVPDGRMIGISKVARVVDAYARRLQVQENLTKQIADTIMGCIRPRGVGVVIEARHLCMMMRGVEKQNSLMKTSCLLGILKEDHSLKSEFMSLLGHRGGPTE